ncbi:cellulase family glycosylhydrolase [Teredinibacter purpureus]|uniref:cellulase family glycosylhydrolase n=1 Tax=Teredinibacter purpureus TaxID=2731756 RepID=UPI0005F864B8|nr:cellulase family glycosylhydrolase [Teredinibacter purpureus]
MKNKIQLMALLSGAAFLQACGGSSMLGTSDSDDFKLTPDVVTEDLTKARPSANAPVILTNDSQILTPTGQEVLLRGINLAFGDDPLTYIDAIDAIAATGANTVRLKLLADTHPSNLEAALNKVVANGMVAELVLWDDALACNDDEAAFANAVNNIWLDEWLDVIAQDHFQPHIMINVASGWGPADIFNGYSTGYKIYIDNYKTAIRAFRNAGFNVPLVISSPGCGSDYFAFVSGRAKELMAADDQDNLILSVHGYGSHWKTGAKAIEAMELLTSQDIPVLMSEFGGSGVGEVPVRHNELMVKGAGDYSPSLDIPWETVDDKVAVNIALENGPVDITNSDIFFDVKVADAYIDDGNMGVQVYLRDANENYANLAWKGVGEFEKESWNTFKHSVKNTSSFGWAADGFDLTAVTKIGIELVANNKPVDITGAIQIDNFKIIEGSGSVELVSQSYDSDVQGWDTGWNNTVVSYDASGAVAIAREAGNADISAQNWALPSFGGEVNVSARVFMPADYEGSWLYFKFFNSEGDWIESGSTGNFTYGDWTEVSFNMTVPAGSSMIGIQIGSVGVADGVSITDSTAAILIDDMVVATIATNDYVEGEQFNGSFDADEEGFAALSWGDSTAVIAQDGNLSIALNNAGDARMTVTKSNWDKVDFLDLTSEPLTLKTRILFPASFEGLSYTFQIFLQDKNWACHFNAVLLDQDAITPGEWMDISQVVDFPVSCGAEQDDGSLLDFARDGTPQHFGFEIVAAEGTALTTDAVLMDYFIVEGLIPVEKEDVVLSLVDFFYLHEFENLAVDYTDGGLVAEGLLDTALSIEQRSAPFSWIASSWFGNTLEEMDLDMTYTVDDAEDLTPRGDEIVNGKGGIKWN